MDYSESELKAVNMSLARIHGFTASQGVKYNTIKEQRYRVELKRERKPLDYLTDLNLGEAKWR